MDISLPKAIYEVLMEKARERGMSIEELIADTFIDDPDYKARAKKYIEGAKQLIEQAKIEVDKGDLRQASEKIWGACALAIKAYALFRDGKVLETHADLWVYKSRVALELGDWVRDVWAHANTMHKNFYEDLADKEDVEKALSMVEKLVESIASRFLTRSS